MLIEIQVFFKESYKEFLKTGKVHTRPLFDRTTEVNDNLGFPFNEVIKVMRCIFGANAIVLFNVYPSIINNHG